MCVLRSTEYQLPGNGYKGFVGDPDKAGTNMVAWNGECSGKEVMDGDLGQTRVTWEQF